MHAFVAHCPVRLQYKDVKSCSSAADFRLHISISKGDEQKQQVEDCLNSLTVCRPAILPAVMVACFCSSSKYAGTCIMARGLSSLAG